MTMIKSADLDTAVTLNDVTESFIIDFHINSRVEREKILALDHVNFSIKKGECVAILGTNGAGKTTLLKLIAGILKPDSGEIDVNGRVACLLDLGAGFNPNMTGRANIFLLARLYGIEKKQIMSRLEQVIEFSGIGRFIDAPLKYYSSGMYVRLAFSLAIHINPDILLIDDCLAVGDEGFQKKCIEKICELKEDLKTIIFVSHDANLISMIASRGIFLRDGRLLHDGEIKKAFIYYTQIAGDINGIGILENGDLSVVFNNGKLYLNWKKVFPLTKSFGGFTILQAQDRQILSKDLHWKIESIDKELLVAVGLDISLGLRHIWKIRFSERNCIEWHAAAEASVHPRAFLRQVNLMLSEKFNKWSTPDEDGIFPSKFLSFREWQVLKTKYDTSGMISAYDGDSQSAGLLPQILLESSENNSFRVSRAIITGIEQAAKVISLGLSASKTQDIFSGKIRVFEDNQEFHNYLAFRKSKLLEEHTIQDGNVRIFFDQGRLLLFYKEIELTKASGFFNSFYVNQRWFNSFEALCEVKKEDAKSMLCNFSWPELRIKQLWRVSLLNENEISWRIILEAVDNIDILSYRSGIFLSEKYSEWFSTYEEGIFPEEFSWKDIVLENRKRKTAGIKNVDRYPGILFDASQDVDNNSLPVVQNTDSLYKSRVISALTLLSKKEDGVMYPKGSYEWFSGVIRICPEIKIIEEHIASHRKNLLEENKKMQALRQKANTIQNGATKIIFDSGSVHIFYNELKLTEDCGMHTLFDVYDIRKELNSKNARWQVNKISENRMVCFLNWDDIASISQRWEIVVEDSIIELLIAAVSCENVNIYNERTGLLLSKNYRQWLTAAGENGEIDYNLKDKTKGIPIKNNKSKLICVGKNIIKGDVYPGIFFNSLFDAPVEIISMTSDKDTGLGIYFLKVDQRESIQKTPGEYIYFKSAIILDKENQKDTDLTADTNAARSLSKRGPLKLFFDNGTMKFFWKNKQITKGLGLYTSFCSRGQWYDSSQAVWKIEDSSYDRVKVRGIWPWIPLIQTWSVKLDNKRVFLDVSNEIYREVELDMEEVNLLLTDEYGHWFAGEKQGIFHEEFSQNDFFRLRIWAGKPGLGAPGLSKLSYGKIGVKGRFFRLPSVAFKALTFDENASFVIENANIMGARGRLVQYLKISDSEFSLRHPSQYIFFKGLIELNAL